jgi:hypothetical protein
MQTAGGHGRLRERGFALILAILSLMLLTFLGLTLATTTSTELQIATNYRWSQQALYNAEAGLEAARVVLSNVADPTAQWSNVLPVARTSSWVAGSAPAPTLPGGATPIRPPNGRDFQNENCDLRGNIGYGRVLVGLGGERYEDVSSFEGRTLNGAFTIWIRRPVNVRSDGQYTEDPVVNSSLIVVSEGVAPYSGAATALTSARQATRVLETRFGLQVDSVGNPCGLGKGQGQEGGSPMGENFNPCAPVTPGAGGSLGNVFGGAEAGGFTSTGIQ